MSCEPEKGESNLAILKRVLAEVQSGGITDDELETAKSKLLSRLVRSGERPFRRLVPLGMNWTYYGEYRSVDDDLKAYEAVTLADVRQVIEKYPLTRQTILTLGPLEQLKV
jgi:predicted Zn-dependent peptidase